MEQLLLSMPGLIVIGLLGMFVHFMKKNIRGETTTAVKKYFHDHFKSTTTAIIVTIIGVVSYKLKLSTGQTADIVICFMAGFNFDSLLNKWDSSINPK